MLQTVGMGGRRERVLYRRSAPSRTRAAPAPAPAPTHAPNRAERPDIYPAPFIG